MRIARVATPAGALTAVVDGERLVPVGGGAQQTLLSLAMAANADPALRPAAIAEPIPLAGARLLAPVPSPGAIRDFYAFEQHVRTARSKRGLEMNPDWYELPVFYFSNPYAVLGPADPVAAPPRSAELDFELEVALVVGAAGRGVGLDDAAALVAGFCVLNDWSARDVQRREMALSMGPVKGKDFATSLGPWLVTAAEFAPDGIRGVVPATMLARVNGVEYSRADLADVYFSFAEMLAYASEAAALRPGDVLGSGTCGTGCILELALTHGSTAYPWLAPGDLVELEVAGLGVLANPVVATTDQAFTLDESRRRPG
ncbi:MAG TPA: fumarylacetoacetate hydrolase family protein [Mycobacteriales bacterium]|nr:fumarylacetoacetate hydrolase family protein [Mycobacteriales bacterium]